MQLISAVIEPVLPSFMLKPLFWVLMLLFFAIWQFIRNKLRIDVIALIVIACFGVSGLMTPQELIAGWGNPNIVLVALLFIVSEGIVRTGLANQVSDGLLKIAGENEVRIMCLLMFFVTTLGSVMSSTGIVAIFIPVVLAICQRMKISPKVMMMPLSIAGLVSGMMTLIATAPNLVANAALIEATGKGFNFFTFTPIGFVVLFISILYMLFARRWLTVSDSSENSNDRLATIPELMENYHLRGRIKLLLVDKESELIAKSISSLNLRVNYGINIVSIERVQRLQRRLIAPYADIALRAKDLVLVDVFSDDKIFEDFIQKFNLKVISLKSDYFSEHSNSLGMAEVLVAPNSPAVGRVVNSLSFRARYGLTIAGIKRDDSIIDGNVINAEIRAGDVLLVLGVWQQLLTMESKEESFFILNTPQEIRHAVPASEKAPYAFASLAIMVILMVSGIVPNMVAALIACLLMGLFRCIDLTSAYKSVHWPLLILIVGMMPFSLALQRTGGIELATSFLTNHLGNANPHILLMVIFLMTALAGTVVSTTTSTILVLPIAISLASQFSLAPEPFVMTVAIAASAAFLTPLSPVNTMILVPSGYSFMDFMKIGTPLMLLVMLATIFVVPYFLPF